MNKYHTEQTSRTLGTVMIAGMLAGTFLPSDCNNIEPSSSTPYFPASNNYAFASHGTSPTHELNKNILTGHYPSSEETIFEAVVTRFYEELSSNQEALGQEFERVLFENLWDLYQS
ncbi:MAG: hypothetical protein ACXWTH_08475 [Methylosarcina sp.]